MTSDADERYLDAITDDVRRILGAGVVDLSIEREDPTDDPTVTRLVARYRLDGRSAMTVVEGPTVIAAHARLREQLVIDRLALGFLVVVDPGVAHAARTSTGQSG